MSKARTKVEIERELMARLADTGVKGLATAGPTFVSPAVSLVAKGEVTVDEIIVISVEHTRRRRLGDKGQGEWRALWYSACWARTQREYLDREPKGGGRKRGRRHQASLPSAEQAWAEREAQQAMSGRDEPKFEYEDECPFDTAARRGGQR